MEKQEIIRLIERWSAPYTPLDPLELYEIEAEQKQIAATMSMADLDILLDLYKSTYAVDGVEQLNVFPTLKTLNSKYIQDIKEDVKVNIACLVQSYNILAKQELADHLFALLTPAGPAEVICFIGLLNDDTMRVKVLEQMDFDNLKNELLYEVEGMIEDTFTLDVSQYRNKLK